jgi:Mn-dependent DtxR family transcriptional regulator
VGIRQDSTIADALVDYIARERESEGLMDILLAIRQETRAALSRRLGVEPAILSESIEVQRGGLYDMSAYGKVTIEEPEIEIRNFTATNPVHELLSSLLTKLS